jgi:hypothetical protein
MRDVVPLGTDAATAGPDLPYVQDDEIPKVLTLLGQDCSRVPPECKAVVDDSGRTAAICILVQNMRSC